MARALFRGVESGVKVMQTRKSVANVLKSSARRKTHLVKVQNAKHIS